MPWRPVPQATVPGICYLIHLDQPVGHARHYRGWCGLGGLPARMKRHKAGRGSHLLRVARDRGITWQLARTWPGTRATERQLKNRGGAARLCPICKGTPPDIKET